MERGSADYLVTRSIQAASNHQKHRQEECPGSPQPKCYSGRHQRDDRSLPDSTAGWRDASTSKDKDPGMLLHHSRNAGVDQRRSGPRGFLQQRTG